MYGAPGGGNGKSGNGGGAGGASAGGGGEEIPIISYENVNNGDGSYKFRWVHNLSYKQINRQCSYIAN